MKAAKQVQEIKKRLADLLSKIYGVSSQIEESKRTKQHEEGILSSREEAFNDARKQYEERNIMAELILSYLFVGLLPGELVPVTSNADWIHCANVWTSKKLYSRTSTTQSIN